MLHVPRHVMNSTEGLGTYIILTAIHADTPHALRSTRGPSHQPVPLQTLVIASNLAELAQGIASSRALRATKE